MAACIILMHSFVFFFSKFPASNVLFMPSSEKGDLDRIPPPSHLALPVVCRQPQQKSGRKQPETNTSLMLTGNAPFYGGGKKGSLLSWGYKNIKRPLLAIFLKWKKKKQLFSKEESVFNHIDLMCLLLLCFPQWAISFRVVDSRLCMHP